MDFLYKMYSNEYFALVLFSVISVLLALFIIVLIIAMKDTKKRKLKEKETERVNDVESTSKEEGNLGLNITKPEEVAFKEESVEIPLEKPEGDITLEMPIIENSMNELLDEFDSSDVDDVDADLDALIAKIDSTDSNEKTNILEDDADLDDGFELPAIKKVENVEEISESDFPELKIAEEEKEVVPNIDLEKTGVINFSNVETESYEIKK